MSNADVASRATTVLEVTSAVHVLGTIFVVLRLISRAGVLRRTALDDYFMILAWVSAKSWQNALC
jgi:hypothetical protein